ncbi:MAG TPA: hypothetical protein VND19_15635 [Acetobacteraceae bacterium]|nr:hypothetical protein [Acetobacteraceae bacterium]
MGRYPVLQSLSGLARFLGWVGVILGGLTVVVGVIQLLASVNSNELVAYAGLVEIGSGLSFIIASLMLILLGEVIKVFVDIEGNTSETTRLLKLYLPPEAEGPKAAEAAAPEPQVVIKSIPAGFRQSNRRAESGDPIFHPTEGLGVVSRPGRSRYFVVVRFEDSDEEKEVERFGLYHKMQH